MAEVPLHMTRNMQEPQNYRLVSLKSVACKLCKKVIKGHWADHLETKMTNERHFGFRQGKSCVTNLLCVYLREMDGQIAYIWT